MRFTSYMTEEERKEFLKSSRFYYVRDDDTKVHSLLRKSDLQIVDDEIRGLEIRLFKKPFKGEIFNDFKEALNLAIAKKVDNLKKLNQEGIQKIVRLAQKIAEVQNRIKEREEEIAALLK